MNVIFTILVVLIIIAGVFLTLVVLLQNGKGGGLASNFTAGNQTFGVRQTADLLEKITWGLVAFIFVASIVTTFSTRGTVVGGGIDVTDEIQQTTTEQMPEFPAAQLPDVNPELEEE